MLVFVNNIIIGLGWALVFITIIPYIIAVIIVLLSKEKNPKAVKLLKLYLLIPLFLILISVVKAILLPKY